MRSIGLLLVIPALVWSLGFPHAAATQSSASAPLSASSGADLVAGTTICATLTKPIDSRKAKPGEAIAARVTLPVLSHGKVLIPNDAKIIGHVTLVQPRSRDNAESELAILFDHALLKDGGELPLALTIQAIGRPAPPAVAAQDNDDPDLAIRRGSPSGSAPTQTPQRPFPHPPPGQPPQAASPDTDPQNPRHPVLDASNHGAIGLPDLTLTESADAATGSMVRSLKNDVKLDTGTELVLRVVGSTGSSGSTTNQ
ncbi:MAG TPA: hypothetical protein VJW93_03630 [Candidatus Acidoferrales bacterium]|nr:hypothetical protein [Candidatus Acidoferrales bacterium]